MKTVAIGDIHGRPIWKKIVNEESCDKVIFIGDYFDSLQYTNGRKQLDNFMDIIEYKKSNMDKVIVFIGNHDFHYLKCSRSEYSGFQAVYQFDFEEQLQKCINDRLITVCHQQDKFMFSHAGISKTWLRSVGIYDDDNNLVLRWKQKTLADAINDLLIYKPETLNFYGVDKYGDDITQSPIWIRPQSLIHDTIDDVIQVVGHTAKKEIVILNDFAFIDTLAVWEYLVIEDGKMSVKKVKPL